MGTQASAERRWAAPREYVTPSIPVGAECITQSQPSTALVAACKMTASLPHLPGRLPQPQELQGQRWRRLRAEQRLSPQECQQLPLLTATLQQVQQRLSFPGVRLTPAGQQAPPPRQALQQPWHQQLLPSGRSPASAGADLGRIAGRAKKQSRAAATPSEAHCLPPGAAPRPWLAPSPGSGGRLAPPLPAWMLQAVHAACLGSPRPSRAVGAAHARTYATRLSLLLGLAPAAAHRVRRSQRQRRKC